MDLDIIHNENCLVTLGNLPSNSVGCIVTSPPYWGLRDYENDEQIGLEVDPKLYVDKLSNIFNESKRVLKETGTFWLNLGDSYAAKSSSSHGYRDGRKNRSFRRSAGVPDSYVSKSLMGMPWRVAFALMDGGWILRNDIIWHKSNPMPESVKDRFTRSHEYLFFFTKSKKYYFDQDSVRQPHICVDDKRNDGTRHDYAETSKNLDAKDRGLRIRPTFVEFHPLGKNRRDVWTIGVGRYEGAHFAVYPEKLIEPCIMAGCPAGGVVYDPFMGSGTTAAVAKRLKRHFIGSEINQEYISLALQRLEKVT